MNNSNVIRGLVALLAVVLLSCLTAGCSDSAKKSRHLERANKFFGAGQYEQARIEYMNVMRLERTNQMAIRNLGLMAFEQGGLGQAFVLLSQAKKTAPEDFQVCLRLAQTYLAGGGAGQAREEALALLAREPANEEVLRLLVESSATNQLDDARQRLLGLASASGQTAGYQVAWGLLQLRSRDLQDAEASFRKALLLDPKSSAAHVALGNLHALRNEREQAVSEYKRAMELAPARSPLQLYYADFKLATGELAEARKALEEISKQTPDYLPAKTRLARLALDEHRLDDCDGLLKDVLARDPSNLEGMLLLARLGSAQDEPAKAVAVLQQIIKQYPNVAQVHYQLAVAQLKNNNTVAAVNSLNQALSLQTNNPEAALLLAQINIRKGELASAITLLTTVLQNRPGFTPAQLLLAAAFRARGDLDDALQIYQEMARTLTTNAQPVYLAGLVQRQQGKKDEARKSFEQALALSPDSVSALEQLVSLDLEAKRFEAAKTRLQQTMQRNPKSPQPMVLLAQVHLAETNMAAAEAMLLKAVEVAPDAGAAHALLASIYVSSNRQQEALQKLQDMVARRTNDVGAWLQIAQLHGATSNYTAAANAYEQILAVNPQFGPALNNLAWLCLEHLGDPKRAYELASKARRLQTEDPSVADTLGWVLYRSGEYSRALAFIKESADKLPDNPDVMFHLGMAHYSMGEETAARTALRAALTAGGEPSWRKEAELHLGVLEVDPLTAEPAKIKELRELLARSPGDAILQARLAGFSARESQWAEAAAGYEKALNLNSNLVPVMVKLAQLYSARLNEPQRALALARQARKLEPGNPSIAHTLGRLAYDSAASAADYQWAFSLLDESARLLPSNPEVLFDYAWVSCSVGRMSDAVDAMQKVAQTNPPSSRSAPAGKFLQMNALLANPAEAEPKAAEVQELVKAQPDHIPALMVMGLLQERKGDFKAARDTYEQILKRFPLFSPAIKRLAGLYSNPLRDANKAYDYATRARQVFPQDAEVARILGLLEFERGAYSRAAQLLTESTGAFPADAEIQYRLGMAQHELKRKTESRQALTKALELAPNSPLASEAKRRLKELE